MKTAIVLAAAAVALAGCTFKSTTVQPARTPPPATVVEPAPVIVYQQPAVASPYPTIAYTVMGDSQFNQAAVAAANWCNTNHRTGAQLIDRRRTTAGDVVTFACTAS